MSKSLDRLALLSTFARISERGSISAAAKDLGLSQASASRQLAELEDRLGVQLIHRTTHSLSLTEAGQSCLVEARNLLADWDALSERFSEDRGALSGKLKVVAPVALGQLDLSDALLSFQVRYPKVEISWLLSDELIRFSEIGCDLWIKIGPVPDETLIVRRFGRVERMIAAAPSLIPKQKIAGPADVLSMPCAAVQPFEGGAIPLFQKGGKGFTLRPTVALETNNIFVAHKAALQGIGFAVLPKWMVASDLAAGRLVDLLPKWRAASLDINAGYLPVRRQTRRLQLLIEFFSDAMTKMDGILLPDA